MTAAPLVAVGLVTAAALAGAVHLVAGDTPFEPSSAGLAAVGMLLLSVVCAAGVVIARSRWARGTGLALSAVWLAVAGSGPLSATAIVLVIAASAAATAMATPWLGRWLRRLPSADGPPPSVVALLLVLVATPAATGLSSPGGIHPAAWAWAGWSLALGLALSRAVPGTLAAARIVHPALGAGAGALAGLPGATAIVAAAAGTAALAWRREVGLVVSPVEPDRADPVPFPPELVPPEVLAAAGLDDRGRPLEDDP